jgi:hypothetical protein
MQHLMFLRDHTLQLQELGLDLRREFLIRKTPVQERAQLLPSLNEHFDSDNIFIQYSVAHICLQTVANARNLRSTPFPVKPNSVTPTTSAA